MQFGITGYANLFDKLSIVWYNAIKGDDIMAHMTKIKMSAAGGLLRHDERDETEKRKRSNPDIDDTRTNLNYNFIDEPHSNKSFESYFRDYIAKENIYCLNRKDVNVLISWVVTLPKDVKADEQELFFRETYEFLRKRYGYKEDCGNIVSAAVHLDETTPHLHFKAIPIGYDTKNDRYTVSSKIVTSRSDLRSFHDDLSEHMRKVFGRDIGILNGATAEGNRTVAEIKAEGGELERKAEQSKRAIAEATAKANAIVKAAEDKVATAERQSAFTVDFLPALSKDSKRYTAKRKKADGEKVDTIEVPQSEVDNAQKIMQQHYLSQDQLEQDEERIRQESKALEQQRQEQDERQIALDKQATDITSDKNALREREIALRAAEERVADIIPQNARLLSACDSLRSACNRWENDYNDLFGNYVLEKSKNETIEAEYKAQLNDKIYEIEQEWAGKYDSLLLECEQYKAFFAGKKELYAITLPKGDEKEILNALHEKGIILKGYRNDAGDLYIAVSAGVADIAKKIVAENTTPTYQRGFGMGMGR